MSLRLYQQSAVDNVINWHKYKEKPAIVSIPTGGGKTHIIKALVDYYHDKRILILAHRKELLEQAGTILGDADFCYFSASIGEKRLHKPVVIAGIQSIYNKTLPIEGFDHILVDECHRVPNEQGDPDSVSQYWQLINKLPNAKITGLSATPFRLKGGELTWGEIVYEIGYGPLFDAGYLCPLTNKAAATPELANLQIIMSDYIASELEDVMTDTELMFAAVDKIIKYSATRNSCLIFCVSVKHAELLKWMMRENGLGDSGLITGDTPKEERGIIIEQFKEGKIKFLLNCEVLLEGFDAPRIDMVVCLRPTKSRGLWEQMIGRGIRIHAEKKDCLLLDMAGNLAEHGGLDSPREFKKGREAPKNNGRICPQCETFCKPVSRECPDCGFQFSEPEAPKVDHNYDYDSTSNTVHKAQAKWYHVREVRYAKHKSKAGNITLRVDYFCAEYIYNCISEYLSPYHENEYVRHKVWDFFRVRGVNLSGDIKDFDIEDLVWNASYLRKPEQICVVQDGKWQRVKDYIYGKPDREGSPAGTGQVDFGGLLNDEIPFL